MSLSDSYLQRFGGIARLYGVPALERLHDARFAVIGIGGVGTWCAEALARSGVGNIVLYDLDDICVTNTNRQIHALEHTVGESKTAIMAERLRAINPEIQVTEYEDFVSTDNVVESLGTDFDAVIDCADSANAKTAIIAHCRYHKIHLITVGSAGGKRDPQQIVSNDLNRSINDPLLAKVRSQLRRFHKFSRNTKSKYGVEAVFSTEQMLYPDTQGGVCLQKQFGDSDTSLDCSGGFGSATMVTGSFGFVAAARAIDRFLGIRKKA